jgi:translocation and assembly module TamB
MPVASRFSRALRLSLKIVAYFLLGVITLVAVVLLTINLPPVSGWVAERANAALEPMFRGRLLVRRLGHLDFGGITGADVEVLDAGGKSVLVAHDIDVRLFWPGIAWNAVVKRPETLNVPIDRIALDDVEVTLIDDGAGSPTIAAAFEPKTPPPEPAEGGGTAIEIDELTIETTRVRGALAAVGPIDTDLGQLKASLSNDPGGTHVVLQNLDIQARQLPTVGHVEGKLTLDATLPAPPAQSVTSTNAPIAGGAEAPDAPKPASSTQVYALSPAPLRRILAGFRGSIAGSDAAADVRLIGEQLAATFDASSLAPATISQMVPALSPAAPLSLSAKVDGALTKLAFQTRLAQEKSEVAVHGTLTRGEQRSKVAVELTTSGVNLARLMRDGAATRINLEGDATLDFGERGGEGNYRLATERSEYAGQALPTATVTGQLQMPAGAALATRGKVQISEPGAPTDIEYDFQAREAGPTVNLSSLTRLQRPARLRELSDGMQLTGEVASRAHYDAGADQVDAEVRVNLQDLRHPQLRATRLDVAAHARGRASAPDLELLANLTGVVAGDRKWSRVRVHTLGTSELFSVDARAYGNRPDEIAVQAVIAPGSEELVRSPRIRVENETGKLLIRSTGVTKKGDRYRVGSLTIDGAGHATASLTYGNGLERLKLEAQKLDAGRLLQILGVKSPVKAAKLDIDAEFENGATPRGKLVANVTEITLGKLRGGSAQADLQLSSGKISGKADVELARGAKTHIAIEGVRSPFGGGPAPTLETMTGDIELTGDLDLARLQPFLPFAGIERATGQVEFNIAMKRRPGSREPPAFRARVKSRSLVVVSERPDVDQAPTAEQAKMGTPWTLRGIDIDLSAALENQTANLAARLFDRQGDVFSAAVDFRELGDLSNPRGAFEQAPFKARVTMPRRSFEQWPAPIRPAQFQGALTLQVDAQGTLRAPQVQARGRIDGFSAASDNPRQRSVDIELGAHYEQAGGNVVLKAHDRRKVVLGIDSRWTGDAARAPEALNAAPGRSPLTGDVKIELSDFPLQIVPQLDTRHVRGAVSGKAELTGLGKDAHFSLDVGAKRLAMDRLVLSEFKAVVQTVNDELRVSTRISGGGGSVDLQAKTGLTWCNRLVPVIDQQLEGQMKADKFPLSSLAPLVDGSVSELDGKLDANIRAQIENGQPRLSGEARLEGGVLQLPTIGQRFSDISAKVTITPNSLRVEDVKARGVSGGFKAHAEAELVGLSPVSAKATVSIDDDDKLPLTLEGEAIGDAWGTIETTFRVDEANKRNEIEVKLQKFHVEMPGAPPQGIQGLDQAENVRVGYFRQDRDFVTIPLQPLETPSAPSEYQTVVVVDLGELWVEKGEQAQVGVGGRIEAKLGPELDVTGKIETRRGELDISGKKFEIERGTVTFTGGPPDTPIISAVARYDSPAGYTVYAEYTGTATQGKLSLRSEPGLSQDEILTLLMFGTPDGSFGAGSGSSDSLSTAVSVVGSTAAQGLNRALSKVTDLDVSARVDTSTGAPRPELVLQLTPRVAAHVTQALGEPTPGQSPDRTFVTIELRLASAWSLSTTVGDRGASAFDMIWRRRY